MLPTYLEMLQRGSFGRAFERLHWGAVGGLFGLAILLELIALVLLVLFFFRGQTRFLPIPLVLSLVGAGIGFFLSLRGYWFIKSVTASSGVRPRPQELDEWADSLLLALMAPGSLATLVLCLGLGGLFWRILRASGGTAEIDGEGTAESRDRSP